LALITTLAALVIGVLTLVPVESRTAALHNDKIRADWAARAALNHAIAQLTAVISNPANGEADLTFITWQLAAPAQSGSLSPILVISDNSTIHPLISTLNHSINTNDQPALDALFQERHDKDLNQNGLIQTGNDALKFNVKLLELSDNSGTTVARYGYQILDEQARLDPHLHRSAMREHYGLSASEICLSGTRNQPLTKEELAKLLSFPPLPATPLAFAQALSNRQRREQIKHWFGLHTANDEDLIPAGLPDAGKPKYNLNDLATDPNLTPQQRAENIAEIIDRNLPLFKTRDPSLLKESAATQRRYLNRLAASIVDYIDPESCCTAANDGEPAGRGLFPMVVNVAEQYLWTGGDSCHANIQTKTYVQVWNPYTFAVSGRARIKLANRQRVNFGAGIVQPFDDYFPDEITVSVRPNECKVIAFAPVTQTFSSPTPANKPNWNGSPADSADQTTHQPFEFYWNACRADMSRRFPVAPGNANSGMVRNAKTLELNKVHYQVCSIPTYNNGNVVGDPRATYLSNYDWGSVISADSAYAARTYWNGRNPRDEFPFSQDFVNTWAARDYIRANPSAGNAPGKISVAPDEISSAYDETMDANNAPFSIRKGQMESIGELGNIFDPAQAANDGSAPKGGTPASVFVSGGGRTLRIGQPEFAYWDHDGTRAIELLDIFTVNPGSKMRGRININTAPKEVLEALFDNIEIKSDIGAYASDENKISRLNSSRLADAVIAERQKSPFKKLSDLYRILPALNRADAYEPRLGDGANNETPKVMDRAREEAFAKFCNLVAVQSRNYRVYAVGQALAPNGAVAGTTYLEAIVALVPEQNANGKTIFKPKFVHVETH
jgi:hypothetical protein